MNLTYFPGNFSGKHITVKAIEPESKTKLLGPAAWNQVYIHQGNIIGVPVESDLNEPMVKEAVENGIHTGISYVEGLAADAAYKIEEMVVSSTEEIKIRSTICRSLSDINLQLEEVGMNYITGRNKAIDLRGPIFSTITAKIEI